MPQQVARQQLPSDQLIVRRIDVRMAKGFVLFERLALLELGAAADA